jgi:dipeptidyl aminopeptidase/acylaminoacyl peptidase
MRGSAALAEVERFYREHFRPGTGHVYSARDLQAGGGYLYFQGLSFPGNLYAGPEPQVCRLDLTTGAVSSVRHGARLARPSPVRPRIALVEGDDVLILDAGSLEVQHRWAVNGLVEKLAWSPDGERLAFLVAGAEADVSGAEGGYALRGAKAGDSWLPEVDSGDSRDLWRCVHIWSADEEDWRRVTAPPLNIWEFDWLGSESLVVIASDHHSEASWYRSSLRRVDLATGQVCELYRPGDQLGVPTASPDGRLVAFIETVCSDRGIVCGALCLWGAAGVKVLATGDADISDIRWLSPTRFAYAGLRGPETVLGELDLASNETIEHWASVTLTCGEWHPSFTACDDVLYLHVEAYDRAPALARIEAGRLEMLHDFGAPGASPPCGRIEPVRWTAPDGLEIGGWLIRGPGDGPAPLLVEIHGGPIWAHRNRWALRLRAGGPLAARGWAILLPNMRGAPGRGVDFVRGVVGDMGGKDAEDIVSGIEALAARGVIDRSRVAVSGTSYGGFMSAWLVTQVPWLAAAVPISPISNWYSQHFTSQIGNFDAIFLKGSATAPGQQYFERSPAFFAQGARTPTLLLAGARDKNTPPTQALEFHHALLETGCRSVLCTYPEDGHSLRGYPAYLDSAARVLAWLEEHV